MPSRVTVPSPSTDVGFAVAVAVGALFAWVVKVTSVVSFAGKVLSVDTCTWYSVFSRRFSKVNDTWLAVSDVDA